jgi:hypothetical protein
MTLTAPKGAPAAPPPGAPGFAPGVAPPRRTNPRRRSPALVSLGVVLVVLGALAGWRFVGIAASGTHPYLAVYNAVPMGGQIQASDLQVVHITPADGLLTIGAGDIDEVVGTYAKVDLYPGTLLTTDQLTHTPGPGVNDALIGLQLQPDQRPGRDLKSGDHVMLVEMPDPAAANSTVTPPGGLPTWPATVIEVEDVATDGSQVVDVQVARPDLAVVAALADASRVAVVLVAGS